MKDAIRKIQFVWAVLALLIVSPFIIVGPSPLIAFLGKDLGLVYVVLLVTIMVTGLLMLLLQLSVNAGEVEPLGAMGRVVVLITTAISVGALLIHTTNPQIMRASVILVGLIFGSLLGLALCYVVRVFRKTSLNG